VLRVRPVVRFESGSGRLAAHARTPLRGVDEMRRLVREGARRQGAGPCGEGVVCTVFHGDAGELAEELERRLREDLPAAELSISEMTAAMAIHVGPGVVGEAFYVDPATATTG
jgi:fatty acid-binding protein DegV